MAERVQRLAAAALRALRGALHDAVAAARQDLAQAAARARARVLREPLQVAVLFRARRQQAFDGRDHFLDARVVAAGGQVFLRLDLQRGRGV